MEDGLSVGGLEETVVILVCKKDGNCVDGRSVGMSDGREGC